jgi:hypothetical protein
MDYSQVSYTVYGVNDIQFKEAISLWKTRFPDYRDFKREIITTPLLEDFGSFMEEIWDTIPEVGMHEAFGQSNLEKRRLYFNCIGIEKLFKNLDPTLLDTQTVTKKRTRWDDDNNSEEYVFEDTYELYKIDQLELGIKTRWGADADHIYAVKCKCTTTAREYWLYVPLEVATNLSNWKLKAFEAGTPHFRDYSEAKPREPYVPEYDAIRAIAWTIQIDVTNPERIYRQGDIIVCKLSPQSEVVSPYHITKDQYLNLMYSET